MTDHTLEIPLPSKVTVLVYKSTDPANEPGTWIIKASIDAINLVTGQPDSFSTTWQGGEPTQYDIFATVLDMVGHELKEQMGLKPHERTLDGAQR